MAKSMGAGNNVHRGCEAAPIIAAATAPHAIASFYRPADKRRVNQRRDMHGMVEPQRARERENSNETPRHLTCESLGQTSL